LSRDVARDPFSALRWRLARRFAAVAGALLLAGGAALYAYVRTALLDAAAGQDRLAIISLLESIDATAAGFTFREAEFTEEVVEVQESLNITLVQLLGADGRGLWRDAHFRTTVPAAGPERELVQLEGQELVIHRRPLGPVHGGGMLIVGRRADVFVRELEVLRHGLAVIVPLALLAALLSGWFLSAKALEPAERAYRQQRAFIDDASHELRTPIAVVRAHVDVALESKLDDPTKIRESLSTIQRATGRLGALTDELLFLARSDGHGMRIDRRAFRLDHLVEDAVEGFAPLASRSGHTFTVEAPEAGVTVHADPELVQRLVDILVENAITHAGRGPVRLMLGKTPRGVQLRIVDSGPGIPAEFVSRAFDRFSRGDTARTGERGGTGLGLAIAKAIVEAHGGTISIANAPDRGTMVTTVLP